MIDGRSHPALTKAGNVALVAPVTSGTPALAAVAGEFVTADAAELARTQGVWQVMDGRVIAPESASS
ncbi:MAG: hypothetical protein DME93_12325 [Verrucomicrobia bacterium]|nr:MAG: hypothetical protein DME93_12325 [Verrucomicrobiota bacterium]